MNGESSSAATQPAPSPRSEGGGDAGEVDTGEHRDDDVDEERDEQQRADRPRRHPAQAFQRRLLDPAAATAAARSSSSVQVPARDVGARRAAERGGLQVGQDVARGPSAPRAATRRGDRTVRTDDQGGADQEPGLVGAQRRPRRRPARRVEVGQRGGAVEPDDHPAAVDPPVRDPAASFSATTARHIAASSSSSSDLRVELAERRARAGCVVDRAGRRPGPPPRPRRRRASGRPPSTPAA